MGPKFVDRSGKVHEIGRAGGKGDGASKPGKRPEPPRKPSAIKKPDARKVAPISRADSEFTFESRGEGRPGSREEKKKKPFVPSGGGGGQKRKFDRNERPGKSNRDRDRGRDDRSSHARGEPRRDSRGGAPAIKPSTPWSKAPAVQRDQPRGGEVRFDRDRGRDADRGGSGGGQGKGSKRRGKKSGRGGGRSEGRSGDRDAKFRGPSTGGERSARGGDRGGSRGGRGGDRGGQGDRGRRGGQRGGGRSKSTGPERVVKATIDKNQKGFGFLIFGGQAEDAFVPPRQAEQFFHGDRVEAHIGARGEIISIKLLEHRFRELVGRYSPQQGPQAKSGGWVIYERKRAREEVYAPLGAPGAKAGDWVRAKLQFHEKGPHAVTAEILAVYGADLPASADISMIAAEYNLIEEHSKESIAEAESFGTSVDEEEIARRTDLRDIPFITIDGETARDFDDAVYVERGKHGYVLWVGIADVSHYVKPGSPLDIESRSRGTSVYFPERAFHMLPRALSENLCSLKPNVPRLSIVARIEFDKHGKRQSTEVIDAVILSKRRATYNEIQTEWEANKTNPNWEYKVHFELYQALKKARHDRGSMDFDLPEAEIVVDKDGEVISITNRARLDSHRLIEEMMIAANEAVTDWTLKRKWPFIYRIHEEPAPLKLEKFQELANSVGVNLSFAQGTSPKVFAEIAQMLKGHAAESMLNMALLRSMKQAIYSSTHGIHFGLASEGYTHFTSPIRRYPDLVVHRILREALHSQKGAPQGAARDKLEKDLVEICEHCSYRERLASDADRDAIKLKQVRAMLKHVGDEFEAVVTGMTEIGMFVRIQSPFVEGLVLKENMKDDLYEFNETRMIFFGVRKRRTFKMGDPIHVRVLRADVERRQIDFGMIEKPKEKQQT